MHTPSEGNFEAKESLRTFVPWFSMEELQHVYSNVFCSDPKVVREGYKYLLVWKTRRSIMPPGVEATFNFCEVILQDGKFQDSPDELFLPQLRLAYATTIMRFLNLVLNTTPGKTEKRTLFHLADAVGIPRWIVDIRHDSAHGSVLPEIGVLRSAAKFSMDWLKERYWEEALKMNDLVTNDGELIVSDHDQLVNRVYDCWENVSIFKLVGFSSSKKKKLHPELWVHVNEIATSLKSKQQRPTKILTEIDEALLVLNQKIKEILRNRRNHFIKSIFVKKMMFGESFLPSERILSLCKARSANEDFPEALVLRWSEIIDNIWESGSLPLLLGQLVNIARDSNETAVRRGYAILWLRQMLLSLIKVKESKKVWNAIVAQKRLDHLSEETVRSGITVAVDAQRPELRGAYNWSWLPLPRCVLSTDLIERCLISPVPSGIHILLPSMMELLDPPLPSEMQESLKACLAIVNNRKSKKSSSDTLFTLSHVLQLNPDINDGPEPTEKVGSKTSPAELAAAQHILSESPWKRSSDIFSWSRSALGILPWQYDNVSNVWKELGIKNAWDKEDGNSYNLSIVNKSK